MIAQVQQYVQLKITKLFYYFKKIENENVFF